MTETTRTFWRAGRRARSRLWSRGGQPARCASAVRRRVRCGGQTRGSTACPAGRGGRCAGGGGLKGGCASSVWRGGLGGYPAIASGTWLVGRGACHARATRGAAVLLAPSARGNPAGSAGRRCPSAPRDGAVACRGHGGVGLGSVPGAAVAGVAPACGHSPAGVSRSGLAGTMPTAPLQEVGSHWRPIVPRARSTAAGRSQQCAVKSPSGSDTRPSSGG
jgi:hypothetical protein